MVHGDPVGERSASMNSWFRKYLFVCGLVLLLVAIGVFVKLSSVDRKTIRLPEVIAETDRIDAGWRLADLDAGMPEIPEAENAALVLIEVAGMIPRDWPPDRDSGQKSLGEELRSWPKEKQFDDEFTREIQSALAKIATVVHTAERLADLPRGRFPLHWSWDNLTAGGGVQVDHEHALLPITKLLTASSLLKAQQGDFDGALLSCRAALNAGRSFGDHVSMNSFLVRDECRTEALRALERVLAQGEPSAAALEQVQSLLEVEESLPLLINTLRLERALGDKFLQASRAGEFGDPRVRGTSTETTQATMLKYMNRWLEIANLPMPAQIGSLTEENVQFKQSLRRSPLDRMGVWTDEATFAWVYLSIHLSKFENVQQSSLASQAGLRCAIAASAAERFRQAEGRWPQSISALVPRFLKDVPSDPFVEATLRLLPADEGLIIYSVGIDSEDHRGNLSVSRQPGTDLGFRLWNVKRRRQVAETK